MNLNLHRFSERLWLWGQRLRRSRPVSRILDHPRVRRVLDDPEVQISFEIAAPALAAMVLAFLLVASVSVGLRHYRYSRQYQEAAACYAEGDYLNALLSAEAALDTKQTARAYLLEAEIYMGLDQLDHAIDTLYVAVAERHGSAEVTARLEELKSVRATMAAGLQTDGERWISVGAEQVDVYQLSLDLSDRALSDAETAELDAMVYLSALDLSGNRISDLSPLRGLVALRTLDLSDNAIADLSDLSHLRSLRSLSLDGCTATDLSPLSHLKRLTHLSLHGVSMTSKQLNALQDALPNCEISYDSDCVRTVRTLRLGGMTFDSDVEVLDLSGRNLRTIRVLSECTNLKYLDLRGNRISDLTPLQNLTELEWLCLWDNRVSDLSPLKALSQLAYLDLDSNAVTDISALCGLPALEELWLNGNPIADFTPLYAMPQLTRLGLHNVGLTDDVLQALSALPNLIELDVTGNPDLTADAAVQPVCPDCVVLRDSPPVPDGNDWSDLIWPLPPESETEPMPETPETELPEQLPDSVMPEQIQPALPSAWLQWLAWVNLWLRELVPPEMWEGEFLPPDPAGYPEFSGADNSTESADPDTILPDWEVPETTEEKIPSEPRLVAVDAADAE